MTWYTTSRATATKKTLPTNAHMFRSTVRARAGSRTRVQKKIGRPAHASVHPARMARIVATRGWRNSRKCKGPLSRARRSFQARVNVSSMTFWHLPTLVRPQAWTRAYRRDLSLIWPNGNWMLDADAQVRHVPPEVPKTIRAPKQ